MRDQWMGDSSKDGSAIGENPLSMDWIFSGWMNVLAMDSGFSEKLVERQPALDARSRDVIFPGGRFQTRDENNKSLQWTRTSRADEPHADPAELGMP